MSADFWLTPEPPGRLPDMEPAEERAQRVLAQFLIKPTPPDPDTDDVDTLAAWLDADDSHVTARALARLQGHERVVAVLHYLDDLSLDDIASLLHERRRTVDSLCFHARQQLARDPDLSHRYTSQQKQARWRRPQTPDEGIDG